MGSALQERQESHYEISTEGDREAESEIESLPCPLSGGVGRTAPEKAAFQWILKDGCALPPQRQEGGLIPRGAVMKLQRTQASPFSYCSALSRFITAASTSPSPSPLKTPISSPLRFSPRLSQTPCRPPASIRRYPGPSASCCRTVLAPIFLLRHFLCGVSSLDPWRRWAGPPCSAGACGPSWGSCPTPAARCPCAELSRRFPEARPVSVAPFDTRVPWGKLLSPPWGAAVSP